MSYTTLITPDELAAELDNDAWRIVDCRFDLSDPAAGRRAWQAQHVPGAVFADLEADLSAPLHADGRGGRHPLPDPDTLVGRLGSWGIGQQTQVVVYDDIGGMMAGRLWWLLRWLGHDAVAVLDGGFPAWTARRLPVTSAEPEIGPTEYNARPGAMPVIDAAQVAAGLRRQELTLIDVRAPERFSGQTEPLDKVAGHVPGAINLPLTGNLDGEQRFRPADELREHYMAAIGGTADANLAIMCGSGVSACHSVLAMAHAGLPLPALYTGSWSDWISDPTRPVASG
ncbi:MAG: sulfurtransferase [Gammaproteobacteria bacterium]|nr:sulfurtransferase [Gammaproteobacteria bacterium]